MSQRKSIRIGASLTTDDKFDLASLLSPVDLDMFFGEYWQKTVLFVPKRTPDVFDGLFSSKDVESLLNLHHFQPGHLQLLRSQDVSQGHSVGLSLEGLVDLPKLYAEFQLGATLLMYNVHDLSPSVARCCRVFEEVLQSQVEVTAVCTSRARDSSAPHYDPHDVFVVQLEGSKVWRVYEQCVTWPLHRLPVGYEAQVKQISLGKPILEVKLSPGDRLYVPRGFVHAVEVEEAPALHLSFVIEPLTWTDLLSALVTTASAEHPPLREALPLNFLDGAPPATRERLRELLHWLAENADLDAAIDNMAARLLERLRPLSNQRLQQVEDVDHINLDTRLRKRESKLCHIERDLTTVTFRVPGHAMRGPIAILPALTFIANTDEFTVGILPRLTNDAKLTLARRLFKEGIVKIIDDVS